MPITVRFDNFSSWPQAVIIPDATRNSAGVMSAADKRKLDSLTPGGNDLLVAMLCGSPDQVDVVFPDGTVLLGPVYVRSATVPAGATVGSVTGIFARGGAITIDGTLVTPPVIGGANGKHPNSSLGDAEGVTFGGKGGAGGAGGHGSTGPGSSGGSSHQTQFSMRSLTMLLGAVFATATEGGQAGAGPSAGAGGGYGGPAGPGSSGGVGGRGGTAPAPLVLVSDVGVLGSGLVAGVGGVGDSGQAAVAANTDGGGGGGGAGGAFVCLLTPTVSSALGYDVSGGSGGAGGAGAGVGAAGATGDAGSSGLVMHYNLTTAAVTQLA